MSVVTGSFRWLGIPNQRVLRLAVAVGVACSVVVASSPVGAQEAGEPEPPPAEGAGFREVGRLELPAGTEPDPSLNDNRLNLSDLWMWPEGRLGYLATGEVGFVADVLTYTTGLVAVDLDTLEERARIELPLLDANLTRGRHNVLAIDPGAERIYVAHHNTTGDLDTDPADPIHVARCKPSRVMQTVSTPCFGGVYVLDARTLEPTGPEYVGFDQLGLDGIGAQLALGALSVVPAGPVHGTKLLVLVAEHVHNAELPSTSGTTSEAATRTSQQYVAQIDVASGRTDWFVALNGCTGMPSGNAEGPYGSPVIFRSPDPDQPHVWVTCWTSGKGSAGIVRLDLDESDPETSSVSSQQRFLAPASAARFVADPSQERILVKTNQSGEQLWWVFDGRAGSFVGRVGIGPFTTGLTTDLLDAQSGRLYTFARRADGDTAATSHSGGLGFTDTGRNPVPQYQFDPTIQPPRTAASARLAVDPSDDVRSRRVFLRKSDRSDHFVILEDTVPISRERIDDGQPTSRSHDVPEVPGVTSVRFLGSARGYGFRNININGIRGIGGTRDQIWNTAPSNPCSDRGRTLSFGLAGAPDASEQASIDHFGSGSATARATYVDGPTRDDLAKLYSRCRFGDSSAGTIENIARPLFGDDFWDDVPTWAELTQLGVREIKDEPGLETMPGTQPASCALPDPDPTTGHVGDPVLGGLSATVTCEVGEITGEALARLIAIGPLNVGSTGSRYRVEHRDGGGIVAHVDSWARGISIVGDQGTVTIDGVRSIVTAWANGRAQPDDVKEHPNCDTDRTAGSCLRREFSGVTVLDGSGDTLFSCDPCADRDNHRQMIDGMQRALGSSWIISSPDPDPERAAGSADGAEVSVLKPAGTRFGDETLKNDLLPTIPALELVSVRDTPSVMGRQVFQFAGVEADLSYGIVCLLTVVDGECTAERASLEIALTNMDGEPLQGALFQVKPDPDGNGEIGLDETLLEAHACTTGPGGTCTVTDIAPGSYVVSQATAPLGYLPAPDVPVTLPEGGQGRLDVVNGTPSVTGIAISLHDRTAPSQPLEGAVFEIHTRTEAVAAGDPATTCTTNANGTCEFVVPAIGGIDPVTSVVGQDITHVLQVPPGPYTIRQASAPDGYEPVGDIPFDLPAGQIARVGLTNAPVAAAADDPTTAPTSDDGSGGAGDSSGSGLTAPPADPVTIEAPAPVPAPQFTINVIQPTQPTQPTTQVAGAEGDTYNLFQNPVQSARVLLREPKQAAAFGAAWLLFGSALAAAWRRRLLVAQMGI